MTGRADSGLLHVDGVTLEAPEYRDATNAPAVAYARPHEIEVERYSPGQSGIRVQLSRAPTRGWNWSARTRPGSSKPRGKDYVVRDGDVVHFRFNV